MIRWREERPRSFRAIAILVIALMVGGFVRVAVGFVLDVAVANTIAAIALAGSLAVLVFRAVVGRRDD